MRLVFLGSPPFATPCLARVLASPFAPLLVVTTPDRPRGRSRHHTIENELAALARAHGVEVEQPQTVQEPALLDRLRSLEPEVILVCAYGEYLKREFRELPTKEILNVHPSLLPRHRGASPIQSALRSGDDVTGVSIQRVVKEMDAGDVAIALECPIEPEETAGELAERLAELGGEAGLRALAALEDGTIEFQSQDESRVTLCTKLTKEDGAIDWSRSATQLANLVRAMNPWPAARTRLSDEKELLVLSSRAREGSGEAGSAPAGTVLAVSGELLVQTGEGVLELLEVKPAGKRAMSAADFLRGSHLEPGTRLGT